MQISANIDGDLQDLEDFQELSVQTLAKDMIEFVKCLKLNTDSFGKLLGRLTPLMRHDQSFLISSCKQKKRQCEKVRAAKQLEEAVLVLKNLRALRTKTNVMLKWNLSSRPPYATTWMSCTET